MIKDARIVFFIRQSDSDEEASRLEANGTIEKNDKETVIKYTEPDPEMGNSLSELQILSKNKVILKRNGLYSASFVIEKGKAHPCIYKTPFGEMELNVTAQSIFWEFGESRGKIRLCYRIDDKSGLVGENELLMSIKY